VAATLALALGACTTAPRPVSPTVPQASTPQPGAATPAVAAPPAAAVVSPAQRLLREAHEACARGDVDTGLARLDRALRIEPRDAGLYLEMARCHGAQGNPQRAAAAAERGLAYCTGRVCERLRAFLQ
jgi:hypothetical protein